MKWKYTNLKSRSTPPERLYTFFAHLCRKWGTPARWLTAIEVHISYSGYSRWMYFYTTYPKLSKLCRATSRMGTLGSYPGLIGALCYSMYVLYRMFLMVKHWFSWKYQYNKYMFNFIDIYIFIPVSGYLCRAPVHCFTRGHMMLLRRPWILAHKSSWDSERSCICVLMVSILLLFRQFSE